MTGLLAASEDIGKAGPVGLFLVASLLVVVFFLGRSMRTHLRRVPYEFPDSTQEQEPEPPPDQVPLDDRVIEGEIDAEIEDKIEDKVVDKEGPETPRTGSA